MKSAKELFLIRYENDLHTIARQYLRIGEPLEDMLQDGRIGILWAFDNPPTSDCSIDEWVRQAIRKHITDALRHHAYTLQMPRRLAETSNHHPVIPLDECPEARQIPDCTDAMHLSDCTDHTYIPLYEAISKLPQRQQIVIRLTYGLDGNAPLDTPHIARLLRITPNAVHHIRHRALQSLRSMLHS